MADGFNFNKISVLIVEDSNFMSQIMKTLLNRMGFGNIYQASDGADALKIFKSTALDVILVDWEMPYLNGETIRLDGALRLP